MTTNDQALRGGCFCAAVRFTLTPPTDVHVSYEERAPWLVVHDGLPKHRGKTDETLPE